MQKPSNPCKHGQRTLNGEDDDDDDDEDISAVHCLLATYYKLRKCNEELLHKSGTSCFGSRILYQGSDEVIQVVHKQFNY